MVKVKKETDVIQQAMRYIESGWTGRSEAEDNKGDPCKINSRDAVKFSMFGAIRLAAKRLKLDFENDPKLWRLGMEMSFEHLPEMGWEKGVRKWERSKDRTKQDVLDLMGKIKL